MPLPRIGVAVIVQRGDRVLLGRRRSATHGDGTWQFPGGHLEFGETVEACAVREVLEETGLAVEVIDRGPWVETFFRAEGLHYVTLSVFTRADTGDPQTLEPDKCHGWAWFRWTELPAPLFAPARELVNGVGERRRGTA